MQADDVVVTTSQGNLYVGTVAGPAEYVKSEGGLSNLRRTVDWVAQGHEYGELSPEIKARLQVQYDVVEMTQQLDLLEAMLAPAASEVSEPVAPPQRPLVLPDATDELASSLHVDRSWLQEWLMR